MTATERDHLELANRIITERHVPIWQAILKRMATYDFGEFDWTTDDGTRHIINCARAWHRDMIRLHSQAARALDEAIASIPDV